MINTKNTKYKTAIESFVSEVGRVGRWSLDMWSEVGRVGRWSLGMRSEVGRVGRWIPLLLPDACYCLVPATAWACGQHTCAE